MGQINVELGINSQKARNNTNNLILSPYATTYNYGKMSSDLELQSLNRFTIICLTK